MFNSSAALVPLPHLLFFLFTLLLWCGKQSPPQLQTTVIISWVLTSTYRQWPVGLFQNRLTWPRQLSPWHPRAHSQQHACTYVWTSISVRTLITHNPTSAKCWPVQIKPAPSNPTLNSHQIVSPQWHFRFSGQTAAGAVSIFSQQAKRHGRPPSPSATYHQQ